MFDAAVVGFEITLGASSGWSFLRVATATPPPSMMPSALLRAGCGMPSPPGLSLFRYACENATQFTAEKRCDEQHWG